MARAASRDEFISAVAQEMSSGIERALHYWLGRIELEVLDQSISTAERLFAIEQILQEYKDLSEEVQLGCASA